MVVEIHRLSASELSKGVAMPSVVLGPDDLATHLQKLPGWRVVNNTLTKQFAFRDFLVAVEFVNAAAENAEAMQHHPDIDIRYSKVTLGLSTHDAGGLTSLDVEFAAWADETAGALRGLGENRS